MTSDGKEPHRRDVVLFCWWRGGSAEWEIPPGVFDLLKHGTPWRNPPTGCMGYATYAEAIADYEQALAASRERTAK